MTPKIFFHDGDLPSSVEFGRSVALDTETMGLNPHRDALCLAQLSAGDGHCHIVRFQRPNYDAPNLATLLGDHSVTKIIHYARFDVAVLLKNLGVTTHPIFCTHIASKLVRTNTDKHGLKELLKEFLDIDVSKQLQRSDWGAPNLSQAHLMYAASDVAYLHKLKLALEALLVREDRADLAEACFSFVRTRAQLDLAGWPYEDIFAH